MRSTKTLRLGSREITLETGEIARQAGGAVVVRQADTLVLVTAVAAQRPTPGADFFPLTVEYREKTSAAGRIAGGYIKRETKISDHEVLISRLIDRSVRPLFPEGYLNEVQVMATVLSSDPEVDPAPLAILGAGAALHLSDIPWEGPAAGLRIGRSGESFILLPTPAELRRSLLDLTVSAGPGGLTMVEGEAEELPESVIVEALERARTELAFALEALEEWRSVAGREKQPFAPPVVDAELRARVTEAASDRIAAALGHPEKQVRAAAVAAAAESVRSGFIAAGAPEAAVDAILDDLRHASVRRRILEEGRRLDGRDLTTIRPITGRTGWLPRAHGSALFTRGETQAMVSCTLASKEFAQRAERLHGEEEEQFMLHYNFPPYSVGEVRALRGPGRREIGHGNLARRALLPVLPDFERFPYVVRVVSDISESNGSSSMATVCGGCLALMDAGVPLARPVAGIAMGLVAEGGRIAVLSDILGDEDHLGDMDFKVAGTSAGVTAVQMDNKIGSLPAEALAAALEQARAGRFHILEEMARILPAVRGDLKSHAPRVNALRIRVDRIRDLIGPRGATIQEIEATTGADITIDDDGLVLIYAKDGGSAEKAIRRVEELTAELHVGRCYKATVVSVKDFGAFVRIYPGTEGLVHISEMAETRVERAEDVAREGDAMVVRVLGVERNGKIRLSRKAALGVADVEIVNR